MWIKSQTNKKVFEGRNRETKYNSLFSIKLKNVAKKAKNHYNVMITGRDASVGALLHRLAPSV